MIAGIHFGKGMVDRSVDSFLCDRTRSVCESGVIDPLKNIIFFDLTCGFNQCKYSKKDHGGECMAFGRLGQALPGDCFCNGLARAIMKKSLDGTGGASAGFGRDVHGARRPGVRCETAALLREPDKGVVISVQETG